MATKREVLACLEQSQLQRDFRRHATARAVPGLAPELHAYQAAALEWMLQREQRRESLPAAEVLLGGTIRDVRGGVLADEMGLGKTVTVAALVLAAPEEDDATQQAETTRVALRVGGARLPATTLMEKPLPDPPKGERRGGVRAVCVCGDAVSDGVVCRFCGAVAHKACSRAASCACLGSRGAPSENGLVRSRATLVVCPVRSRRPAVPLCLHAIDATRVHQTRSWVVSFSISRPFGPRRATAMLRAGTTRAW